MYSIWPPKLCMLQAGNTALHITVERGYEGLSSQLIEHGASLDVQNQVSMLTVSRAFLFLAYTIIGNLTIFRLRKQTKLRFRYLDDQL